MALHADMSQVLSSSALNHVSAASDKSLAILAVQAPPFPPILDPNVLLHLVPATAVLSLLL